MKRNFKRNILGIVTLLGLAGFSSTASAITFVDPVNDANHKIMIGMMTKHYAEFTELNLYLHGMTTGGNGLVEGVTSMNEKLGQLVSKGKQDWMQQDMQTRRMLADQMQAQQRMARQPDSEGCAEATFAGGRGAASSTTTVIQKSLDERSSNKARSAPEATAQVGGLLRTRAEKGYCQASDKGNGCSGEGEMPGADVMVKSMYYGATKSGEQTNQSLTDKQVVAASALVDNITGLSPKRLTPEDAQKTSGKVYTASANIYNARLSAAQNALNSIVAMRTASSGLKQGSQINLMTGDAKKAWPSNKDIWARVFPGEKFPETPSEFDLIRFDIFSRYADSGDDSWQTKVTSYDDLTSSHEMLRMQAIQLKLSLDQLQKTEQTNTLLAAILAQSLSPITQSSLEELANKTSNENK